MKLFSIAPTFHFSNGSHLVPLLPHLYKALFKPKPKFRIYFFYQLKLHALNPLPVAYVERVFHLSTDPRGGEGECLWPAACVATHIKSAPCVLRSMHAKITQNQKKKKSQFFYLFFSFLQCRLTRQFVDCRKLELLSANISVRKLHRQRGGVVQPYIRYMVYGPAFVLC